MRRDFSDTICVLATENSDVGFGLPIRKDSPANRLMAGCQMMPQPCGFQRLDGHVAEVAKFGKAARLRNKKRWSFSNTPPKVEGSFILPRRISDQPHDPNNLTFL